MDVETANRWPLLETTASVPSTNHEAHAASRDVRRLPQWHRSRPQTGSFSTSVHCSGVPGSRETTDVEEAPTTSLQYLAATTAVTIEGILRDYPTSSIGNHTVKVFGYDIENNLLLTIGGEPYSLN